MATTVGGLPTDLTDILQPAMTTIPGAGESIDDLIGQIPGLGDVPGSVQDKLQSLVETGNLGEALGNLSSNELTQLVSSSCSRRPRWTPSRALSAMRDRRRHDRHGGSRCRRSRSRRRHIGRRVHGGGPEPSACRRTLRVRRTTCRSRCQVAISALR